MSIKKTQITTTLIILAIVFTLEYFAQGAWIIHLQFEAKDRVAECKAIPTLEERTQCFEEYVEDRNHHAILGVNGYLISILSLTFASGFILYRARKRQKGSIDGCDCK